MHRVLRRENMSEVLSRFETDCSLCNNLKPSEISKNHGTDLSGNLKKQEMNTEAAFLFKGNVVR